MRIRALYLFAPTLLIGLFLQNSSVLKQTSAAAPQQETWVMFAPPEEEIAVQIPGPPIVRNFPIPNQRDDKQEKILTHHAYDGYGSGLVFVIDSFKAEHPEKLSEHLSMVDKQDVFERLFFDGVAAELFRNTVNHRYAPYSNRTLRFMTSNHLYVIHLMSLDESSPAVDQVLSSLKVRKPEDRGTPVEPYSASVSGPVLNYNEVTRRAIVVWKREPRYTDEGRAHKTTGRVVLDLVFAYNGYVSDITTVEGLENGLTESAIEAARSIHFFPAQKDGKPVSQRNRVEYNFNLY